MSRYSPGMLTCHADTTELLLVRPTTVSRCALNTFITSRSQVSSQVSRPASSERVRAECPLCRTTYYYTIPGGNGTTPSDVLSFTTAPLPGDQRSFSVAVINDMGYTDAKGTHAQLIEAVDTGVAFAWHGGDTSYADDWFEGGPPLRTQLLVTDKVDIGILACVLTGPQRRELLQRIIVDRSPW